VYLKYFHAQKGDMTQYYSKDVKIFFMSHFGIYMLLSWLITGAVVSGYRIEQYLYLINYIFILIVLQKLHPVFEPREINESKWGRNFLLVILFIALLALVAINTHGDMPGMQQRFEF
jgi:hypothetical protein